MVETATVLVSRRSILLFVLVRVTTFLLLLPASIYSKRKGFGLPEMLENFFFQPRDLQVLLFTKSK